MKKMKTYKSFALFSLAIVGVHVLASCAAFKPAIPSVSPNPTVTSATSTSAASPAAVADSGSCAADIKSLKFGIVSPESDPSQKALWEPFIEVMTDQLHRKVNPFYANQYTGVIESMGTKKIQNSVQIAWYSSKSYIEAAKIANAEAFAQVVKDDGSKGFYSYLITNESNPILTNIKRTPDPKNPLIVKGDGDRYVLKNASQLAFAFNDPDSTSGFLVPSYFVFSGQSIDPNAIFKQVIFTGSNKASALAVANNQVDVATTDDETLAALKESDPESANKIAIIWTSPMIPTDAIAYRQDLPDCLKTQIKDFFYNYKDPKVLQPLQWSGFDPAQDTDWNTTRQLEITKMMLDVKSSTDLSEADKQTKLDELKQQLDAVK